jgi:hypothetical protein
MKSSDVFVQTSYKTPKDMEEEYQLKHYVMRWLSKKYEGLIVNYETRNRMIADCTTLIDEIMAANEFRPTYAKKGSW